MPILQFLIERTEAGCLKNCISFWQEILMEYGNIAQFPGRGKLQHTFKYVTIVFS